MRMSSSGSGAVCSRASVLRTRSSASANRALLNGFDNILTFVLALVVAWRSYLEAVSAKEIDVTSALLGIPRYPFIFITAYGFLMLFFAALILLIRNVKSVKEADKIGDPR